MDMCKYGLKNVNIKNLALFQYKKNKTILKYLIMAYMHYNMLYIKIDYV